MEESSHRYFIIHKPYKMVSQFISPDNVRLLGDLDFDFPEGTHAIGRLDNDSEGLLILTTNKKVTRLLFEDTVPHTRTYVVKGKHVIPPEKVKMLNEGVSIKTGVHEHYLTQPCEAAIVERPQYLTLREGDYENHPHTWLRITLTEGKYHQVRKMMLAIGHRCQRLIRTSIEGLELGDMKAGEVRELAEEEFFRKLNIKNYR
ncbi:pseudouridine synthase [Chitinophaga sp. Hz27]|uniref:pseudouridine synthase n=1 Tax=Chitinophaga sp. Hz27 TaxID=3347169 RepID=UPI0035DF36DC